MLNARPDPDQLLSAVQQAEERKQRGRLKIFVGYAAGVGKTYAMLENAQRALAAGTDVVLGYIEPHARPETSALLPGLESLSTRTLSHRGISVREFDVDAALIRQPQLILVDELAHSNAEGCRHAKRWQDVEELLAAGIDVWSTLNVQHIESLNDIVTQVTGVTVRETLPDAIFETADELELVDIAPDDLLNRLDQGKIYAPDQACLAAQSFFQRSNLNALRELAMRQAARRIHSDVELSRRDRRATQPWSTSERLMVCVGPSPTTAKVIRTAKRMADALDAPWLAASVESPATVAKDSAVKEITEHFRLAESLGAEIITLYGEDVAQTLIDFARARNVTKILIGKSPDAGWRMWLRRNVVDQLLDKSGDTDVFVIQGAAETRRPLANGSPEVRTALGPIVVSLIIVGMSAAVSLVLRTLNFADSEANTAMIFLAGVSVVAYLYGRAISALACVVAVLIFDYFFVPPFGTFEVADTQYLLTFLVMLTIGLGISSLTERLRQQIKVTQEREQRTAALYVLGKQLSSLYGRVFLCNAAADKITDILGAETVVYLPGDRGMVEPITTSRPTITSNPLSLGTAQWVTDHGQMAGRGTDTLPAAPALFVPLLGAQSCLGALAVSCTSAAALALGPQHRHLLESCAGQLALALERDQLVIDAADARIEAETEQLRSSLLSSVSHDLRTPLATIAGASSSLLTAENIEPDLHRQLLQSITDEAARLSRLLENILQMSSLESSKSLSNRQWHVMEELVGSALRRTEKLLGIRTVEIHLPADLPLVFIDGLLIEQLMVNLLENAGNYTPPDAKLAIIARIRGDLFELRVEDNGPGIPSGTEHKIFEKFFRAVPTPDSIRGSGLGLAICRAIAVAHQGALTVESSQQGGAAFVLSLPMTSPSPTIPDAPSTRLERKRPDADTN